MNFLFDLTSLQPLENAGKVHGGGKYAFKVFLALLEAKKTDVKLYATYRSSKAVPESVNEAIANNQVVLIDLEQNDLRSICEAHHIHSYYSPLPYDVDHINALKCKVYGTMHGLRQLETSVELHALNYFLTVKGKMKILAKWLLNRYLFDKKYKQYESILANINVITVSEHSKFSILSYYPGIRSNIRVFYSPDVTEFSEAPTNTDGLIHKSFFLLVSGDVWYKNNLRSAIALDNIFSDDPSNDKKVVITGVTNKEVYLSKLKNKDRFVFFDYVEESFLLELYTKAFCLIYMSLNEGFGYPPLEAMKQGVPVVASPFTSITEVCADAVIYANPYSVVEIKNRILQVFNSDCYLWYTRKGLNQYTSIRNRQDADLKLMVEYLLQ